ncbi:hypothetical protein RHMOL_Rhmol11G0018100 [Rhododendron molle]|uniref:Uncharacterized protein n=1 Tax=Rhododendron molle TaxID=49168 RepID=A0ACC0LMY6_RHOML|nr:hypothetical protein RHMOL_Rhmol11G0018100 [Rhododendron molle]
MANSFRFLEVSICSIGLTNWGCRWDLPSQRGTSSAWYYWCIVALPCEFYCCCIS